MSKKNIVSILTPNYNSEKEIIEFLDSILLQDFPLNLIEIIIIDNGSKDNSINRIVNWYNKNKLFYRTQLIELGRNMGIAYAYNIGYENISPQSEIIIRTESDVELDKNCIRFLVDTLKQNHSFGIVGAKGIFFYDKKTLNHATRYLNWWNGKITERDTNKLSECDIVFGGTFALKTRLVRELGYFFKDSRFFASELELCTRVKNLGYKVLCQPKAVSYHKGGGTTRKINQKKFAYIDAREITLFHLQYNQFPHKLSVLFYYFLVAFKELVKGNFYKLWGFISGILTFVLKKDVLLPINKETTILSNWLFNKK